MGVLNQLHFQLTTPSFSYPELRLNSEDSIIGLLLVAVSLPFLIRFIYRRFPAKNQPLPYFANEAKAIAETTK